MIADFAGKSNEQNGIGYIPWQRHFRPAVKSPSKSSEINENSRIDLVIHTKAMTTFPWASDSLPILNKWSYTDADGYPWECWPENTSEKWLFVDAMSSSAKSTPKDMHRASLKQPWYRVSPSVASLMSRINESSTPLRHLNSYFVVRCFTWRQRCADIMKRVRWSLNTCINENHVLKFFLINSVT